MAAALNLVADASDNIGVTKDSRPTNRSHDVLAVQRLRRRFALRRTTLVVLREGIVDVPKRSGEFLERLEEAGLESALAAVPAAKLIPAAEIADVRVEHRTMRLSLVDGTVVRFRLREPIARNRAILQSACDEMLHRPVRQATPSLEAAAGTGKYAGFWSQVLLRMDGDELSYADRTYAELRGEGLSPGAAAATALTGISGEHPRLDTVDRLKLLTLIVLQLVFAAALLGGIVWWNHRGTHASVGPRPQLTARVSIPRRSLTPGVYLVPFQGFPVDEASMLRREISRRYDVPVRLLDPLPIEVWSWNASRRQLDGYRLVNDELTRLRPQGYNTVVIGLVRNDMYASFSPSDHFRFTILWTHIWGAVGTARLGPVGSATWRERLVKLTLRVAGRESGFADGSDRSVLRPTLRSLADIDRMETAYCPGSPTAERQVRPALSSSFTCATR